MAFVCVLGLLPHVRFSMLVGRLAWFESAYDEATYALWAFTHSGPRLPSRWLSEIALALLLAVGRTWDRALIAADVVFPALSTILAWILIGRLTRRRLLRLALTLGLLFAQEFFSFGCWTIWRLGEFVDATPSTPAAVFDLRWLLQVAPPGVAKLLPNYTGPFLSLFRTPEPQVSMAVLLAALILAIDLTRPRGDGSGPSRRTLLGAAVLNALLAFVYFFVATIVVVLEGLLGALLVAGGRAREGRPVVALAALGGLSTLVGAWTSQHDMAARSWAFHSHLAVLTPATLVAAGGFAACARLLWRLRERAPASLTLAAASFGAVLIVTNQQLVTGLMVSTRDWERYTDYPVVFLGVLLLLSATLRLSSARMRVLYALAGAGLAAGAHVLWTAQDRVFQDEFLSPNLKSLAMMSAVQAAGARGEPATLFVLEEPALSPLLQCRLEKRVPILVDNAAIYTRLIDPVREDNGAWGLRSRHRRELFEYLARMDRTPGGMSRLLRRETDEGAGFALSLLFDLRDWWDPITDGRAARRDRIGALLPAIVQDYTEYLRGGDPCWTRPALVLTRQIPSDRPGERWTERLLGEVTLGGDEPLMNMYALLQTSASSLPADRGIADSGCSP